MSRNRRDKASDVFNKTEPVFGRKVTFEEAYPQIKAITVRTEERGHRRTMFDTGHRTYNKEHLGEFIDCSNPYCYNGGFSIGEIIDEMVNAKKTHDEFVRICQGYEASPKGKRRYGNCMNTWTIVVDIEYFTEEEMRENTK